MAIDEFATCFATKTSADVDEVRKVGEEGWHQLISWWNGLDSSTKWVIGAIAAYGGAKLAALLGVAVGDMVAAGIILFLGGMAWTFLIDSAVECADQL